MTCQLFQVKVSQAIREGAELNTPKIGRLTVGNVIQAVAFVHINGVCRVRVRETERGSQKHMGWASVATIDGKQLLLQLDQGNMSPATCESDIEPSGDRVSIFTFQFALINFQILR